MDQRSGRKQLFLNLVFLIYMIIIIYFLLYSERYGRQMGNHELRYNLKPLREIKRFILYRGQLRPEAFITNLMGNIFAFSPFGFMLPMIRGEKTSLVYAIKATFLFSLCIEFTQLVFRIGVFDVDDLLLNTIGGTIGFLCYLVGRRLYHGKA